MNSGEKWKQFLVAKGWIKDGVITASDEGELCIGFEASVDASGKGSATCCTALYMEEYDLLCCESPSGTVFFQWESITFIRLAPAGRKKKWL